MTDEQKKKGGNPTRDFLTTNNEVVARAAQVDEPRFLSILLKNKERLQDAIAFGIRPHHFRNKAYSFFFTIMMKHYEKHNALLTKHAMESIMDQQKNISEEDKSNRKAEWERLYIKEKDDEDYNLLKANINNRYLQDQAFTIIEEYAAEVVGATAKQDEVVRDLQERINKIEGVDPDEYSLIMPFDKGIDLAFKHIQDKRDNPEKHRGVLTGIRTLDEEFYGFDYGSYTIISGMTNGGKTTLMFNIGFNMAKSGYNVVYISLEKPALPLDIRLLCLHAMVDYNRTKRGGDGERGLDDVTMAALAKAKQELDNLAPNFDIVQMSQNDTLTKILSKVEQIKSQKKIDVLILDYLGCVGLETKTVGRPDLDQANVSKNFQAYCKRNNYVGITGIQIKAASTKEIRKKVEKLGQSDDIQTIAIQSEDMAGSQEVIRDADNGIGVVLHADQPPTIMYVHSTKARDNQGHRTVELAFDGFIGKISDPDIITDSIEEIDENVYGDDFSELFDETEGESDGEAKVEVNPAPKSEPEKEKKAEKAEKIKEKPDVKDPSYVNSILGDPEETKPKDIVASKVDDEDDWMAEAGLK
jgi:replicative DNA helicase